MRFVAEQLHRGYRTGRAAAHSVIDRNHSRHRRHGLSSHGKRHRCRERVAEST